MYYTVLSFSEANSTSLLLQLIDKLKYYIYIYILYFQLALALLCSTINNTSKTSITAINVSAKSNILAAVSYVYVCVLDNVCGCVFVLPAAVLASEIMYMLIRNFWHSDAECDVQ